jgi:hypothetical protein
VLNVHGVHNVREMDVHTAEPLIPEPSLVKVEIAIGNLRSCKSPGTDQILAKLIKTGGETFCSEIQKLIYSIWTRRNCHSCERNLLLYQFIKRVIRLVVIIIEDLPLINCLQNFIKHSSNHVSSICQ